MSFVSQSRSGGFGIASGASKLIAEPMGKKGARKAMEKNLAPVLGKTKDILSGKAQYYGATSGGKLSATRAEEE